MKPPSRVAVPSEPPLRFVSVSALHCFASLFQSAPFAFTSPSTRFASAWVLSWMCWSVTFAGVFHSSLCAS
jgi:hypothetical protein